MADTNRFQLAAAVEEQPAIGVAAATLFTAANAKTLLNSVPELVTAPQVYERQAVRPSLSPLAPIAGPVDCTLRFSTELAGTSDGSGIPEWSKFFEACGMRRVTIKSYTIGAIATGSPKAFHAGETVTATNSGTVLMDTYNGETTIYIYDEDGALSGAGTGGTSGSTATFSGGTAAGEAWVPVSETESSIDIGALTGAVAIGDVVVGDTSGARIVATRTWSGSSTVYFRYISGTLTDAESFTNQTQTGTGSFTTSTEAQVKMPTLSLGVIEDAVRRQIIGCRGKFAIRVNAVGEPALVDWEFKGRLATTAQSDGVEIPSVTRNALVPPPFIGATVRVGAPTDEYADEYSPRTLSWGFDVASTVTVGKDATSTSGLSGAARIRTRPATGNMSFGLAAEGEFPWLAKIQAADPVRVAMSWGSTGGNQFKVQAPGFVPTGGDPGDDEGDALRNVTGTLSAINPEEADADDRELILALLD